MKPRIKGFILMMTVCCLSWIFTRSGVAAQPQVVSSPIEKIFTPVGYDDNDNVELVLLGFFPSTCYKTAQVHARIDRQQYSIDLVATSLSYGQGERNCTAGHIGFIQTIDLGVLPAGIYTVTVAGQPQIGSELTISPHRADSPEEVLYAPVDNVVFAPPQISDYLDSLGQEPPSRLILTGVFPRLREGCMKVKEVLVTKEKEDLVVIQPVAHVVSRADECSVQSKLEFEATVALPRNIAKLTLVQVRVTNGNTLNRVLLEPKATQFL